MLSAGGCPALRDEGGFLMNTSQRPDSSGPATYPNGRIPTDDVYSMRFAWLTNGKVPPSGLKPHDDLLNEFPYLGRPNPPKTSS
jgi:hypothetical protein